MKSRCGLGDVSAIVAAVLVLASIGLASVGSGGGGSRAACTSCTANQCSGIPLTGPPCAAPKECCCCKVGTAWTCSCQTIYYCTNTTDCHANE